VPSWLRHPVVALVAGLVAVPLAKLLWVPNYVFNFLTTLVHECGHFAGAWLMGMPAIPSVGLAGGGVTWHGDQVLVLALAVWLALGVTAWRCRDRKPLFVAFVAAAALYPALAFTRAAGCVVSAGGVLLEVGAASACLAVALGAHLERPIERPLYALWGWWMLINRTAETVLMLRSPAYWERQRVYESGLAAGLTNDLETLRAALGASPRAVLLAVLVLCLLALPAAFLVAWRLRQSTDTIRP
jgi:hypothetical protein